MDTAYSTDLPHVEALRSPMTQPENVDTKARSGKVIFHPGTHGLLTTHR